MKNRFLVLYKIGNEVLEDKVTADGFSINDRGHLLFWIGDEELVKAYNIWYTVEKI